MKLPNFIIGVLMFHGASVNATPAVMNLREITARCAPFANPQTIKFLIQNESKSSIYALHINGNWHLARQPHDRQEAIELAQWMLVHNISFDAGLMQVNSANFVKTGLNVDDLFEPCQNIRAGYKILSDCYHRALSPGEDEQFTLRKALSCYNTGSFTDGFRNGYVKRIEAVARVMNENIQEIIPELIPDKPGNGQAATPPSPAIQHETEDAGAFGPDGMGENDQFDEQGTAAKKSSVKNQGKNDDAKGLPDSSRKADRLDKGKERI